MNVGSSPTGVTIYKMEIFMRTFKVLKFFRFGPDEYYPNDILTLSKNELHNEYFFRLKGWIE